MPVSPTGALGGSSAVAKHSIALTSGCQDVWRIGRESGSAKAERGPRKGDNVHRW